jgi:UDP-glucose 4-epimerase
MEDFEEYYADKNILITGGAGAIGHTLVHRLLKEAKKIVILDDLSSGHEFNVPDSPKIIFVKKSVLDDNAVSEAFSHKIDIVFHLAANFANQNSVENPEKDLLVNSLGTLKILEASVKHNIKKLIYTSSSCVYGNQNNSLQEGNTNFTLDTPYAISKLAGEHYCLFFYNHYKLPVVILRYFNAYGEGELPGRYRNVIPNFIWLAMNNKPLTITGTGHETRDFTYIGDNVRGTLIAGSHDEAIGEVINIGVGKEIKIIDIATKINEITGNKAGIMFIPQRDWDTVQRRCASLYKAKSLGYRPEVNLDEGLTKTYEWIKKIQIHIKSEEHK